MDSLHNLNSPDSLKQKPGFSKAQDIMDKYTQPQNINGNPKNLTFFSKLDLLGSKGKSKDPQSNQQLLSKTNSEMKINPLEPQNKSLSELSNSNEPDEASTPTTENKIKKTKVGKKWTPAEEEILREGVNKFGKDWIKIAQHYKLERNSSAISQKWKHMNKNESSNSSEKEEHPTTKFRKVEISNSSFKKESISQNQNNQNNQHQSPQILNNSSSNDICFETELEEKRKEIDTLKLNHVTELKKKEEKIKDQEKQIETLLEEQKINHKWIENAKKTLQEIFSESSKVSRQAQKEKIVKNNYYIGTVSTQRHSTTFHEVWNDGRDFEILEETIDKITKEKENLEKEKKELSKQLKAKSNEKSNETHTQLITDLKQKIERNAIRQLEIKKEENEAKEEKDVLINKKNLHIKELKRIQDEDHSRFKKNPILNERYVLLNLLGKGGFSEVFKAFDLTNLQYVACKIHQLNSTWDNKRKSNYIKHAVREYEIHKGVQHQYIVRLYDVFEIDENCFCTVLEYCEGQDLDIILKTLKTLPERTARSIVYQLFSALNYLNSLKKPIIHYDLKPGNILFHQGQVKVTDFGLSKIMDEQETHMDLTSQGAGTYWYLPPECFEINRNNPPKISSKVDVWSVGVIFYQMLFGEKPFGNNVSQQKILADKIIQRSSLNFPSKPNISKEGRDFISLLLTPKQEDRPDIKSCFSHPYLNDGLTKKNKIVINN